MLPPEQTWYLFTNCKQRCAFTLDDLLPGLRDAPDLVVSAPEFLREIVPRLVADGRLRKPLGRRGDVVWPPPANATFVDRCTPTRAAPDTCFGLYEWLEDSFGTPDFFPDVGLQCVVFGRDAYAKAAGAAAADERVADFCHARTHISQKGNPRRVVDGEKRFNSDDAVVHVRSSGVATHQHALWHGKTNSVTRIEPARMGRLLAPFYSYVLHADPAVANFYKRLVRDAVRLDEPRVTCVAGGIVDWLRGAFKRPYAAVHARRNEFQFVESNRKLGAEGLRDVVLRAARRNEPIFVATDEADATFFDPIRRTGRPVVLLSELLEAATNASRGSAPAPRRDGVAWPSPAVLDDLVRLNPNELGFVDALVSSRGRAESRRSGGLSARRRRRDASAESPARRRRSLRNIHVAPRGGAATSSNVAKVSSGAREERASRSVPGRRSQGRTFTGSWFSTFTGLVDRLRGYGGAPDNSSFFTAPDRWAAFQGFEKVRSPLYMREWPQAWRGIDGDFDAAAFDGEMTFAADVAKVGYPVPAATRLGGIG